MMDDRSECERNNDAKRHANRVLHEHVLVRLLKILRTLKLCLAPHYVHTLIIILCGLKGLD